MTRRHRSIHRLAWLVLAPVLGVVWLLAWQARPVERVAVLPDLPPVEGRAP